MLPDKQRTRTQLLLAAAMAGARTVKVISLSPLKSMTSSAKNRKPRYRLACAAVRCM